ncbi:MAG: DMT family transporter [Acidimicrobiales bacterium]|nr:DMT family transporter [Acidimicrobiales bacterium]
MWGSFSVLTRKAGGLDGLGLAFHRMWMGALAAVLALRISGTRLNWRILVASAPGGALFALDVALFFTALKTTTIANANIISALQPVLVALVVGRLFGERLDRTFFLWSGLALVGVVAVLTGSAASNGDTHSVGGDVLALAATASWAAFFVASKRARRTLSSLEYLAGLLTVAWLVITPVALASGTPLAIDSAGTWVIVALIALVSGGLGHWLMNWAHAHIPLATASLLTLVIPVAAVATSAVILDEAITLQQVVGIGVVLAALAMVILRSPVTAGEATADAGWVEPLDRGDDPELPPALAGERP